ncbi:ribonuclease Z [Patiriisocius sp. Uisw_017]|jgi:hypothetical protein|uniref:ribonuclease Z n=1 Tax=Patiriisocius sp. Uisw_017 TaxID=3230968 RepID=UPI0039E7E631
MQIKNSDTFVTLKDEYDDIKDFASFLESQIPNKFKDQNVIVDLMKYENLTLEDLLLFIKVSNTHRKNKQSFILVNSAIDPDEIPVEMIVVPTLQEGEDVLEMEEIERDLGF